MLSLNGIVFIVLCVLVSAMDMILPFGDINANLPSGLRFRLCAFGLNGARAFVISSPVFGFTTYQKSFRSDPTYMNEPSGEIWGRSQHWPSYAFCQTFLSVVRSTAARRPLAAI